MRKTIWVNEYDYHNFRGTKGCSIRKVKCSRSGRVTYDLSVSPKRTSWYVGFSSFIKAKVFAKNGAVAL